MTIKKLLPAGAAASVAIFMAVLLAPVQAAVQPYVEGGDIYRARNLTKGTDFSDPSAAAKCEELRYRVRIHNPGPDAELENVTVKAVIPAAASTQNVSTVTVSSTNASPSSRSDTATVNLSEALKVSYVPGSSQLLDANGAVISSIGDVTSGSGVNIGKVGISVDKKRFVQFKAKVDCPQPPKPPEKPKKFKCEALTVATVDIKKYIFTARASVENVTVKSYLFTLFKNGATVGQKTVTTPSLSAEYEFNRTEPGTYIVTAVVNTDAGSTNPKDCAQQIVVPGDDTPPPPPVVPPEVPPSVPPTQTEVIASSGVLPETGPADTASIVALVVLFSSAAYYLTARKFDSL